MSDLWTCGRCGRTFANRNQSHSCGNVVDLNRHFEHRDPAVRALFDALADAVRACGPVTIIPEKSRIAFHTRMSFIAVTPRRDHLAGHLVFARRIEDPRFEKIETISPRNHVHHFRLRDASEIDDAFRAWIREAYAVGQQEHLRQ